MRHSLTMRNTALNAVCSNSGADWFGLCEGDPEGGRCRDSPAACTRVFGHTAVDQHRLRHLLRSRDRGARRGTHPTHWARFTASSGGSPCDSPFEESGSMLLTPGPQHSICSGTSGGSGG